MKMGLEDLRVVIAHGDGVYRECLSRCLANTESIAVVKSVSDLQEMETNLLACKPDLAIVGFGLCCSKECFGTHQIHALTKTVKTIIIGVPDTEDEILACIERNGAAGYVVMNSSLHDLTRHIKALMKGEVLCSPRIAGLAFNRVCMLARQVQMSVPKMNSGRSLTRRELEIVQLIENGLSNKEIALTLNIEVSTVKNHVHNILDKVQSTNRHSAVKSIREQFLPARSI